MSEQITQAQRDYEQKARNLTKLAVPEDYPDPIIVADDETDWSIYVPGYEMRRPFYTDPYILKLYGYGDPRVDPPDPSHVERDLSRFLTDESGWTLNPFNRRGVRGRGENYMWGSNPAADGVVIFKRGEETRLLTIYKEAKPATPGGFHDPGDIDAVETATREIGEETNIYLEKDFTINDEPVLVGPITTESRRNTDNAWIDTTGVGFLIEVDKWPEPRGGDDAERATLEPITERLLGKLSSHHETVVRGTIELLGDIAVLGSRS